MSQPFEDWSTESAEAIRIFGARTHNLRNLDVAIPLGQLTVVTGVSGSGKSSLALDTLYAEGRRRYLSSISTSSRELLQRADRPDVDFIDGLPPVLCVGQQLHAARKRSTVATLSDIYDYLRLLFARVGIVHCPTCHRPVTVQSRESIVHQVLKSLERQKILVLAPVIRERTGSHVDVFSRIVKDGYVRARADGDLVDAAAPPELSKTKSHNIEIVVDRLIMKSGIESRLEESVDLALQLGQGQCLLSFETASGWQDRFFSSKLACTNCDISYPTIEPQNFRFQSAAGACPDCNGLGFVTELDQPERLCAACHGTRLNELSRSVLIEGKSITDFCALSPSAALELNDQWASQSTSLDPSMCRHILPEIATRLRFLVEIGLDYLTLDRPGESLSTGELQRTRLAACLGHQLTGVCYLLDEPTAGLHSRDTAKLLRSLVRLKHDGNTVVLIEHDLDVICAADHVIDLGPGAGSLGGSVLATGTPAEIVQNPASITGPFLKKRKNSHDQNDLPGNDSHSNSGFCKPPFAILRLTGATLHNLKETSIEIPLRQIVCVTGVSGSGKTSLVMQTLVPAIRRALGERISSAGPYRELTGIETLSKLIRIDQSPLGRSSRSTPATYSGLWDDVRRVFAKTKESKLRGFSARQFSLHVPDACCPLCRGRGHLSVDEQRFADWQIRCPECDGRRFSPTTLSVRYRDKSVADVLEMSLTDAALFFENFPRLARTLTIFNELGLGYLKMGQSTATLSGGEAQRVKLGTELAKSTGLEGSTLFVLDEPTAGLHAADIQQLVYVLRRLVSEGHSILIIEHNQQLIATADWQIDIGPDAGDRGGRITYAGPPQR